MCWSGQIPNLADGFPCSSGVIRFTCVDLSQLLVVSLAERLYRGVPFPCVAGLQRVNAFSWLSVIFFVLFVCFVFNSGTLGQVQCLLFSFSLGQKLLFVHHHFDKISGVAVLDFYSHAAF